MSEPLDPGVEAAIGFRDALLNAVDVHGEPVFSEEEKAELMGRTNPQ